MISKFVPNFVTQGITDHDYTIHVMRRYAESSKNFWANIIKKVRSQNAALVDQLTELRKTDLKRYQDSRKQFEAIQSSYDNHLVKYLALSKNKEPSALREEAYLLAESRNHYIRASFDLSSVVLQLQSKLDVELVKVLSSPWILSPKEFAAADPMSQRIGIEMMRLKAWSKAIKKCAKPLLKNMEKASRETEKAVIDRFAPSRELNTYTAQNSTIPRFVPTDSGENGGLTEKYGWLFLRMNTAKSNKQTWVRRWIFVKNGMFGMLNISPSKTFVQESDKVGVLLCQVAPVSNEDRRFCFEVKTEFANVLFQAETLEGMRSWLQVFQDAKKLAIENSKKASITPAFQRIPPMIVEFASTGGTPVDAELTHEKGLPAEPSATGPKGPGVATISLKDTDASSLQALLTGNSVLPAKNGKSKSPNESGVFAPFGSQLAPSPLLNIPMPTAMSQEAIISNSVLSASAIPTAVTANYWGSVNWGLYQKRSQNQDSHDLPVSLSVNPNSLKKYPAYYPPELKAQDTQLRAIFQTEVGDKDTDRVVLAFRGLVQPNPSQQLPGRLYFTSTHAYLYCNYLGMSATKVIHLSELISVEGRTGLTQDTLYFLNNDGTNTSHLFLDSGRLLQKRCQFLIDNVHSKNPLSLEMILEKLKSFSSQLTHNTWIEDDILLNKDSFETVGGLDGPVNIKDDLADSEYTEKRFLQMYVNTYMGGGSTEKDKSLDKASKEVADVSPLADLSKLMSQLACETEFDIPAKALFHIMFGETSPVFKYSDSASIKRDNIKLTTWKLINSQRMEREIHYTIKEASVITDNDKDNMMYVQRLEKLADNACYIIYERRAICKLPQGGVFYTAYRYVITRQTRNSCKLSIWSSVEWIKSSIFKPMSEPFLNKILRQEARIITQRALQCRKQLGARGGSTTAIRLFGKLGSSLPAEQIESDLFQGSPLPISEADSKYTMSISPRTLRKSLWEVYYSSLISCVGGCFVVVGSIVKNVWKFLVSNKILILALICSVLMNVFLAGRSTQAYWEDRHVQNFANKIASFKHINLKQDHVMERSILLKDMDQLLLNGTEFSVEKILQNELKNTSQSLCYDKFQTQALLYDAADATFSPENYLEYKSRDPLFAILGIQSQALYANDPTSALSRRIYNLRSKLGIQRNSLIVELRMINRVETELLMAEWRSFVFDEISICQQLLQAAAYLHQQSHNGFSPMDDKSKHLNHGQKGYYEDVEKTSPYIELIKSASKEARHEIGMYCQSCSREFNALKGYLKKEKEEGLDDLFS